MFPVWLRNLRKNLPHIQIGRPSKCRLFGQWRIGHLAIANRFVHLVDTVFDSAGWIPQRFTFTDIKQEA